jgi:glycosyltransferase involved in cell wall biosynthesis
MSTTFTTLRFAHPASVGFVTVIIPVDNDPIGLRLTLLSLSKQTFPKDRFEILVGNDGGLETITKVCRDFDVVMFSAQVKKGSYAMRNRLIEHSRGEVVAFIDAQTQAPTTWLADGVRAMANFEYVGGAIDVIPNPEFFVSLPLLTYQRAMTFDVATYMSAFHFASTTNLFVSRTMLLKTGGFDRRLLSSGDLEFGRRVIDDFGVAHHFDPDLRVHHLTRSFWQLLFKQRRIAHGQFMLSRLYPTRFANFHVSLPTLLLRLFVPPVWIFSRKRVATLSFTLKLWVFGIHCWMNGAYTFFRIEALMRYGSSRELEFD